jgi:voltage-gated potassium channel
VSLRALRPQSPPYQLFMLFLCLFTLAAVGAQVLLSPAPEVARIIQGADTIACAIFFVDFCVSFRRAPDRWRYFYTWGWIDLLSSIPVLDITRWGRFARVARLLRILRGVRAAAMIGDALLERRRQSAFLAASLMLLLLLATSSILILMVETEPASNIKSAEDAIWWAATTITTVGYGDRFPVTTEGRMIATLLMAAGVGVFGVLSGLLAAWFVEPAQAAEKRDEAIAELRALRDDVRALRERMDTPNAGLSAEASAKEER